MKTLIETTKLIMEGKELIVEDKKTRDAIKILQDVEAKMKKVKDIITKMKPDNPGELDDINLIISGIANYLDKIQNEMKRK